MPRRCTAKMTVVMTGYEDDDPLWLTNIKPNLAKLSFISHFYILGCIVRWYFKWRELSNTAEQLHSLKQKHEDEKLSL